MTPQATVIVPTFDSWSGLQLCLDCLASQTVNMAQFEVIVANNNATPECPGSLRLPPNARVIHVPQPGSYAARNAAITEARAEVLFFTDSDCLPDARWIEAGYAAIQRLGPHGRVAGGVTLFPKGKDWTVIELYDRIFGLRQSDAVLEGWCATANLVTRRAAFDLAGRFIDVRYSGEDRDWNLRAAKLGSDFAYCPEAVIRHPARSDYARLATLRRRVIGGQHFREAQGLVPRRSLASLLRLMSGWRIRKIIAEPGLTDWQRVQVLMLGYRLGLVESIETLRLRYLAGRPERR
jgi:glycosyltransferase involved in cell wall biosynthesis